MPGTVDDFMQRFGGGGTMDENDAAQYHDRFVSNHANDRDFDTNTYHQAATQYLGKLPDDQFHQSARNAVAQMPQPERAGLLGTLMGALGGAGGAAGGLGGLAKMLGLGTTDPNQMSPDDAAKVMNYARREQPQALQQAVAEKPWFVKAMGNPVVMGALTMAAAKLLSNQRRGA
ncbi:MAG: hypothetical protein ACR2FX_04990 [Chthoniobacterales bacterium]